MKMKIEYAPQKEEKHFTFEELEAGDIFQTEGGHSVYMKILPIPLETSSEFNTYNAISLTASFGLFFTDNEEVIPVETKLIIEREIKK